MIIQFDNSFDETKAQELTASLNGIINNISIVLALTLGNKTSQMWQLDFQNGDSFVVKVSKEAGSYRKEAMYFDSLFNIKEVISVQDAMNINKYARDIELKIKEAYNNGSLEDIEGYYSIQNTTHPTPIFNEKNLKERNKIIKSKLEKQFESVARDIFESHKKELGNASDDVLIDKLNEKGIDGLKSFGEIINDAPQSKGRKGEPRKIE